MSNDNKPGGEPSAAELNQAAAAEIHTGMMAIHDVMNEVARVNQPLGLEQLKALLRLYAARRGMIERDLPLKEWESLPPGFLATEAIFTLIVTAPCRLDPVRTNAELDQAIRKAILAVAKWRHEKCTNSAVQVLAAFDLLLQNPMIDPDVYHKVYQRGAMMLLVHGLKIEDYITKLEPQG